MHRTPVLSTTHSPHLAFRVRLHSEDSGLPQHGFQTAFGVMGERTTIDRDIEAVIRDKLSKHPTTLAWSDSDPTIIPQLVRRSEDMFVYASTAAEYLVGQGAFGTKTLYKSLVVSCRIPALFHSNSSTNSHCPGGRVPRGDG